MDDFLGPLSKGQSKLEAALSKIKSCLRHLFQQVSHFPSTRMFATNTHCFGILHSLSAL